MEGALETVEAIIPLAETFLCIDCENVSNPKHGRCLKCGSSALANVTVALGGPLHIREPFIRSWSFGPSRKVRSYE